MVSAIGGGKSRNEVTPGPAATLKADPLDSVRLAEPFEALRDAADQYKSKSGDFPKVFLASLGPIAAHTTRSTWMKNLLAAGGIEAVTSEGYEAADDAARAFTETGTPVACICSSDELYGQMAVDTAIKLKSAGAKVVLLAGRPGDLESDLKTAGVDGFVYAGQDMLELLGNLQRHLTAAE